MSIKPHRYEHRGRHSKHTSSVTSAGATLTVFFFTTSSVFSTSTVVLLSVPCLAVISSRLMALPRASCFALTGAPMEAPSVAISFVLREERAAAALRSSAFEERGFSAMFGSAVAEGIGSDIFSLFNKVLGVEVSVWTTHVTDKPQV